MSLSDELAQQAAEAYREHGSQQLAADALNMSRSTFRDRLKVAAIRGFVHSHPIPTFEIKQHSVKLDKSGNVQSQWIQQVPEAGDRFLPPEGHVIKGVSAYTDPDGRIKAQWIKTSIDHGTPDLINSLKEIFSKYTGYSQYIPPPTIIDNDLLSVYVIADQHHGLLSWSKETGQSYDLEISRSRLLDSMARLISQAPHSRIGLILGLGDFCHSDDQRNVTPQSGNRLDVDGRYLKVLETGIKLQMNCIELALQKHEQVIVRNLPGNHDPHASIALTVALRAFYSNNPRVLVDDDPSYFFFHRFGATLIGATHGDTMKPEQMAMAMATLCREDWGATKWHYFYFGHFHHHQAKEVGDVRCESFQSLAANDAWHASRGFTSGKSLTSITIHIDDGEIGRHRVNIPPVMKGALR